MNRHVQNPPDVNGSTFDPFRPGHEEVVLARLMNYPDAQLSLSHINPEYFSSPRCHIFSAVAQLLARGEAPVPAAVAQELQQAGQLDAVGGPGAVTSIYTTPATDAIAAHAESELREYYQRNRTAQIGERMRSGEMTPEQAQTALAAISDETRGAHGLTVRSAGEILALELDQHDCYMGDRIIAKGQPTVLIGPGGIGKTRMLQQNAAACITGRKWCGFETHAQNLKWLIIQTENSNRRLQTDLAAIRRWLGEEDWARVAELLFIKTLENDRDGFLSLGDSRTVDRLSELIREISPDIIAFDPLRDFMAGDPNSDQDMAATLQQLGALCRRGNPNRAIIVLHHALTGRKAASSAHGIDRTSYGRNSKALFGWTRAQINISPGAEDTNETVVISCGKNSNGKEFESFAVTLNPKSMIYEVDELFDMDGWKEKLASNRIAKKPKLDPAIIGEIVGDQKMTRSGIVAEIRERTGCAKTPAYDLIASAEKSRLLKKTKGGKTLELFR